MILRFVNRIFQIIKKKKFQLETREILQNNNLSSQKKKTNILNQGFLITITITNQKPLLYLPTLWQKILS